MADSIELQAIPIEQLRRGRYQPRREFDPQALAELAQSIRSSGLIQPIVVRGFAGSNRYEIIAGERRWRAAGLANLTTVPCIIHDYSDEQAAAVSTIENLQRQDLNPIETANALQRLIDEFNHSHEELAAIIGQSRVRVTNCLRLLKLHRQVQQQLIEGDLSEGHGKVLAGLPIAEQCSLARKSIEAGWSVRQLEKAIKQQRTAGLVQPQATEANLKRLKRLLSDHLNANVDLDLNAKQGGWLKVQFNDNDTLEGVLAKMGLDADK